MDSQIIPIESYPSKSKYVRHYGWFSTVDLRFNLFPDFPERGFLLFPLPLLREYGEKTQTLAALWAVSAGKPTSKHHKKIARAGCLSYHTFNKHLAALKRAGAVIEEKPESFDQSRLRLSQHVVDAFQTNKAEGHEGRLSHLQIPREAWHETVFCFTFSEIILWHFYRFKCRIKSDKPIACLRSQAEINELTGLSPRTIANATNRLATIGKIDVERVGRNRKVTIPGYEPTRQQPAKSTSRPEPTAPQEASTDLDRLTDFYRDQYREHRENEPHFLGSASERSKLIEVLKLRGELHRASEYVGFVLSNWLELSQVHNFYGEPKPSLLSQSWFESVILSDMKHGIEERRKRNKGTGLANRAGGVDWSKETDGWDL